MKRLLAIFLAVVISLSLNTSFTSASTTEFKLAASDGAAEDFFGLSVAISGDTAVVGVPNDDDNGSNSGSAYVFVRNGSSWIQQAKLTPVDGAEGDNFGYSVAISGDTVVIGATSEDENGSDSGSAYVFERIAGIWTQQARLIPDDAVVGNLFGCSVAVDGATAVIGAYGDIDFAGSAYVFERIADIWTQQARLCDDDTDSGDHFGYSVSVSEGRVMVGAPYDDESGNDSGSICEFVRESDGNWSQQAKLTPVDGAEGDNFGYSVAIYGDTAVVGAPGDDNNGICSGSAYVFVYIVDSWIQQARLAPDDGEAYDYFGWSVAVTEDASVVGAPFNDDNGSASGSAYYFMRDEGIWSQHASLTRGDGAAVDFFGRSLAVSEDIALVGAPNDDDNYTDSGSAYVFNLAINLTPVADAGGPYTGDEGSAIILDASGSYDLDDVIVLYEWDLDNDAEYDDATGVATTAVFNDDGVYTVGLKVTDSYGAYAISSTFVTVDDLGPSGEFSWSPEPQNEGTVVTFTDISLSSPDIIVSWAWDFSGIGSSADRNPDFVFMNDGTYTVTLTVTDDDGSTVTVTHNVTVENMPPEVDAGSDRTVDLGDTVFVEAVFTDPGTLDTHSATIYWGDDTSEPEISAETVGALGTVAGNHIYTWPGTYEVKVVVIDSDGGMGSDLLMVDVVAVPAVMVETLADIVDDVELVKDNDKKDNGKKGNDKKGKGESITDSLDTAVKVLNDSNPKNDKAAVNTLEAFINKLESLRGKKISAEIADELIAKAQEIIDVLNGGILTHTPSHNSHSRGK